MGFADVSVWADRCPKRSVLRPMVGDAFHLFSLLRSREIEISDRRIALRRGRSLSHVMRNPKMQGGWALRMLASAILGGWRILAFGRWWPILFFLFCLFAPIR